MVLYRALAGRAPNDGIDALGELILSLCSRPPVPVQDAAPWVRSEVAGVVHRALQTSKSSRFEGAAEMLAAIRVVLPGALALRHDEIVPVGEAERAIVAPRSDANLVTRVDDEAAGPVSAPEGRARPEPVSETATTELAHTGPPSRADDRRAADARRWQSRAPAILGSALVLGAASFGVYRWTAHETPAPAEPFAMQSGVAPSTPPSSSMPLVSVASRELRRVSVAIMPADAEVEVGGERAAAKDGIVAIHGTLGSTHRVRVFKGNHEIVRDVAISESGAHPAKLEIVEAATPAGAAGAKSLVAGSATARRPISAGAPAGNPAASGARTPTAAPPPKAAPSDSSAPANPLVPDQFQ